MLLTRSPHWLVILGALPALTALTALSGCTSDHAGVSLVDDTGEGEQASTNDERRLRWARYVRGTVQPRLVSLGVDDRYIKRAVWWGLSEGVYTIAGNPGYGQRGGPQSPLGFSNCGDDPGINGTTALPDCFASYAYKSGNWQVGIAGIQVSDYMSVLPGAYRAIYGDMPPRLLGRHLMAMLGEDPARFPDLTIEQLATRANARWASVILRDPYVNVYCATTNPWIRDTGRNLGFGKAIVDQVWAEAAAASTGRASFPETGAEVTGSLAQTWFSGEDPFAPGQRYFGCWSAYLQPCLATYGYPLGNRYAKTGSIPGGGEHMWEQVFERAILQINRYGDDVVVQGRLLGSETSGLPGRPELPVADEFRPYYEAYGGLAVFGHPLEPATVEDGRVVQRFERARLEANPTWDPNLQDPVWAVLRGRLGAGQ